MTVAWTDRETGGGQTEQGTHQPSLWIFLAHSSFLFSSKVMETNRTRMKQLVGGCVCTQYHFSYITKTQALTEMAALLPLSQVLYLIGINRLRRGEISHMWTHTQYYSPHMWITAKVLHCQAIELCPDCLAIYSKANALIRKQVLHHLQ